MSRSSGGSEFERPFFCDWCRFKRADFCEAKAAYGAAMHLPEDQKQAELKTIAENPDFQKCLLFQTFLLVQQLRASKSLKP